MSQIYDLIESLAATSKHTEKEAILRAVIGTDMEELVKNVMVATYDNRINYWIKKFPFPEEDSLDGLAESKIPFEEALSRLSVLANRSITGNAALAYATNLCASMEREDAIILDRVIKRDLRCSVTATTANKIWPDLIYQHPYMRCSSFSKKSLENNNLPCFSQTKADGLYIDIVVEKNGSSVAMTRSGQYLKCIPWPIEDHLSQFPGKVLMGEALILGDDGKYLPRKEGNGILNSDDIPMDKVVFVLWDVVDIDDWRKGSSKVPYQDRLNSLHKMMPPADPSFDISYHMRVVSTKIVNSVDEVIEHFKEEVEKGEEGTVVKDFSGLWADGTSKHQVKVKIEFECELKIKSYKEGAGKHKGRLGAFVLESSEGLVEVSAGGGYSDKQRDEMWVNREDYISKIATVKSNDLIQNRGSLDKYSLFLPRFIEIRSDKTEADSFERVKQQRDDFIYTLKVMEK